MLRADIKSKVQMSYDSMIVYCHDPDVKFMYLTRLHYLITLAIASADPEGISFERICADLDRKISSRSTIQNVLEAGLLSNFFKKSTSKSDRRVQLYTLTDHAEQQMTRVFESREFEERKPIVIINKHTLHEVSRSG